MKANRSSRMLGGAILSLSVVVAGCSRAGGSPAATDPPASASDTQPTATAEASAIATRPVASLGPSPAKSPTAEPPTAEPAMAEPPAATIAVEGGDPVVGQLGTFTWANGGSGAPWLDGSSIHAVSGERFALTLADRVEIAEWSVRRVIPGSRDGIGALALAEGSGWPVLFDAPPSGAWSVQVKIRFANDLGDALYYWMIDVG